MPDGRLWLLRDAYAAQTAWAPRHVGKELRLARLGAFDAALNAIRAAAEADTARKDGDLDRAARHETLATSCRALRDLYQQRDQTLTETMTGRQHWEQAALGDTLPTWWAPRPDGILRPPKPEITPSAKVLQLAADHDIEPEAGG